MKRNGHALVELVLGLWMAVFAIGMGLMLVHYGRLRSVLANVVALGCDLASHPHLSDDERHSILSDAATLLHACERCRFEIQTGRHRGVPSWQFYDLIETRVEVHTRFKPTLPFSARGVVLREPTHEAA